MPFLASIPTWVTTAATLAGAGLSAVSSVASGIQQKRALEAQAEGAEYNRAVALQNAQAAEEAGRYAEEQKRREGLRLLGAQKAAYGKAGVLLEGTPLEVMAETAADLEQEALATRYNYQVEGSRWRSQAGFYGFEAARQRGLATYPVGLGVMKAGTSLLMAGGELGRMNYPKTTSKTGLNWSLT